MVLVDTSIWIAHLRSGDPRLEALLNDSRVTSHPFILGELACGNLKNRREILPLLQALPATSVVQQEELLHFIERNSLAGRGLGFVDVHLLASAQLTGISLWTADASLKRTAARLHLSYT